jgi:hypothetical protein
MNPSKLAQELFFLMDVAYDVGDYTQVIKLCDDLFCGNKMNYKTPLPALEEVLKIYYDILPEKYPDGIDIVIDDVNKGHLTFIQLTKIRKMLLNAIKHLY